MKKFMVAIFMLTVAGCTTNIRVAGNNNLIETSPARHAGQASTIDVLKGMSLPSLSWGGGKEKKTVKEETEKVSESTDRKTVYPTRDAEVEAPEASVTMDKVVVKDEGKQGE